MVKPNHILKKQLKESLCQDLKRRKSYFDHNINCTFGKVREDVKVNSATHNAIGCCNETNHKTYWHFIIML